MYYITYLDMFLAILCSSSGRQNCIFTASGTVTLCERPCSVPVESGLSPLSAGALHKFKRVLLLLARDLDSAQSYGHAMSSVGLLQLCRAHGHVTVGASIICLCLKVSNGCSLPHAATSPALVFGG
jgi:hypothetical protein